MKTYKSILGWIVAALLMGVNVVTAISWDPYYQEMKQAGPATADAGQIAAQTNQKGSLLEGLLDAFDINYAGDGKALSYVQVVINYVISFTAFAALLIMIYGFYMMFFRDQDKGYASAKKTVIGAGIALFVIGISWIFVNFAFYIFNRGI